MQNKNMQSWLITFLTTLSLSACSAHVSVERPANPAEPLEQQTADLADVAADALSLAKQHGKDQVLMVFDIDNTILAMEQGLGADQWYEWQKDLAKHDPCNPQYVGNRFAVQGAMLFASAMRPTQKDAASQVKAIQESGIAVIVVTSRGPDYRLQTFRELRRSDFNFTYSGIGPAGGYDQPFIPVENGRLSRYEDGVFMTAGQHKGKMLYALLQKTNTELPKVIVMADDKQKNLDAVQATFAALDVPVHAWRYTGEDGNVNNFDSEQAHTSWQSIEAALRKIQQELGADNYDLSSAHLPVECQ